MTTIAYRAGILAGDTLCTSGGLRDSFTRKVWKAKAGFLIGSCGSTALCQRFKDWAGAGMVGDSPFSGLEDGNGIVVFPDGLIRTWGKFGPWDCRQKFYTLGSGYQIAMGALEMGATARQAVSIAMRQDTSTGGEINFVRF